MKKIEMIGKLKADNHSLKQEISRLELVNALNTLLFHDREKQTTRCVPYQPEVMPPMFAANDG